MSKIRQAGAASHQSASTQRSHPHDYGQNKSGVQYENTFRMNPDRNFPSAPMRKIINEILKVCSVYTVYAKTYFREPKTCEHRLITLIIVMA